MNEGGLTALLRQHASRHAVPGAAIGILRRGEATTAYYGVADVRTGELVTSGRPKMTPAEIRGSGVYGAGPSLAVGVFALMDIASTQIL